MNAVLVDAYHTTTRSGPLLLLYVSAGPFRIDFFRFRRDKETFATKDAWPFRTRQGAFRPYYTVFSVRARSIKGPTGGLVLVLSVGGGQSRGQTAVLYWFQVYGGSRSKGQNHSLVL